MTERIARALVILAGAAAAVGSAQVFAIVDEIQVYTDDLDGPGERGLELHVNTTPSGRKSPDYEGELPPDHGWRVTPEFSWGLGHDFDWGLYLPSATDGQGNWYLGGAKLRVKWLPLRPAEGGSGWYLGVNNELSWVTRKFSESPVSDEVRFIGGYRAGSWLIGVNPILDWALSPGYRGSPEIMLAWKAVHDVAQGIAVGAEYYNGLGTLADGLPRDEQERTLYLVTDIERKSWSLNFGVGYGLTPATDKWTVKAIFGFGY